MSSELLQNALQLASIVISIMLIGLILLQVKGGGLGTLLGGDAGGGIARTRRGLEKTMYHITIWLSIAFLGISTFSVIADRL
jgi:protein translocase SecG subunit